MTAATAAVALALGTPAIAAASPPVSATTDAAAQRDASTTTVTLLTGDRVTVTPSGSAAIRPGPGRTHLRFLTTRDRGHLTVLPQDALPLVRDGRVDRRLFDVTGLIAAGYDDARRDDLPVLVAGNGGARQRAAAPAGLTVTTQLPAIGGIAATADKQQATTVWAALTGAGARIGTAGGADRIWLDGRRQLTLDHSVPQIGAPAAYQAGFTGQGVRVAVLDTGIDAGHPDLSGRIAEAHNFTEATDAGDTVGHGTHVASIIAGSGAASGGKYHGVAPDATLLNGKVCEEGGCSESAILAGMQWAAVDQHADVINMSLGGGDTPEVDPLEAAVGSLTAQTGALFVLSAGNDGTDGSVGSPGSADAALTVGAVDRDDALADFSSRGPRVGDGGLKPDLTAPGVEIVAARADGTEIGEPVGEGYVALSGTSMAAPHVTGAVALLAQQHTGWTAAQLKATLMASAKPHPEQTAFQQGAGRVDVARAITQRVTSDPVSVSFGQPTWPHDDDTPITRKVDWRNDGPDPLTLDLTLDVTGPDNQPAPAGMFALGAGQVTVPPGGTAGTTLTVDTRLGTDGYWTGRLVARSGTAVAVTPVAVNREVESYQLTVRHLDATGAAAEQHHTALIRLDTLSSLDLYDPDGTVEVRVPKGRYGLASVVFAENGAAQLVQPELVLDGDTTVTVDARRARPIRMTVPERSAAPGLVDVSANFLSEDGGAYGFGLLGLDFTGLTTGHIGRAVPGARFFATVSSQWKKPGVDISPYLYALSEKIPGRMPTGFDKTYRARDLATVTHEFRGGYPGLVAERVVFPHLDPDLGGWAVVLPTAVPGQRVEHYNTRGLRWSSELTFGVPTEEGWVDTKAVLVAEPKAYRAGRHTRESWNSAPYGPSFPAPRWPGQGVTRLGDEIQVDVPLHSDAEGHAGGSVSDAARTALYRDGVLVDELADPGYGQFTVPPGAANYRLEVSSKRSFTDLSTEVSAAWTFRSGHVPGDDYRQLPVSAIRFTPPLGRDNAAPAGRSLVIPVQVQRQPGAPGSRLTGLTVDVSYDGGRSWQPARVRHGGQGWTATVRHPAGPGYASLRATARDAAGNTVTQRIIQAYRLR
ncbi:S8 family serine peptidase [Micromonospora sp. STR1_7]|uniref:S8 family serine peptidase n=1 Tax=Micromonospora parastrephiae TaxID=2806101 RepID=A0ABS1XTV8_9ACTN|nr:S8 family serine peptidase [Micromonospora parastrephiae]MBM0232701.1 S8 family serine peptidase [Micromonospora parastrephiae]